MSQAQRERRPTYEMLEQFPYQGDWSIHSYMNLSTDRAVEFVDGFLEFLPMPDEIHQDVNMWLMDVVRAFLRARRRGVAKQPPFKIRLSDKLVREPDVCMLLDENDPRRGRDHWNGADIVFEVVSEDQNSRDRDYIEKRAEYEASDIREYWIVDPQRRQVLVLSKVDGRFAEAGPFKGDELAFSKVDPALQFRVSDCFAVIEQAAKNEKPLKEQ